MKKTNLLLVAGMLGLGVGVLASCDFSDIKNSISSNQELTKEETFRLEAATSMNLVANLNTTKSNLKLMKTNAISDTDADKIKEMLPTIDLILDNGSTFSSTLVEEETVINEVTYQFKEVINFKNHLLQDESYTLVYNKTSRVENEDRDEIETFEKLEGYALFDENTKYEFVSLITSEEESDEQEVKREFRIILGNNSYVKVSQETEQERNENSTEFEYLLVENGIKKLEYSIEIEHEGNKDEIEYELNGQEYELVRKLINNEVVYRIYYEDDHKDEDLFLVAFKKGTLEDGTITYERIV